jgi:hypothetical protein
MCHLEPFEILRVNSVRDLSELNHHAVWLFIRHQKLQLMAIGIAEVDAVRIALAPVDFDPGVLERGLDPFVVARHEPERHMVDFTAAMDVFAVVDFEERDPLVAALEKTLPRTFMIDFHAEKVDVELSGPREIFDVKDYVVDARNF